MLWGSWSSICGSSANTIYGCAPARHAGSPPEATTAKSGSSSTAQSTAAAAMIFPLAVTWAYLDAIAKSWLALGEKLHGRIYGKCAASTSIVGALPQAATDARKESKAEARRPHQKQGCHLRYFRHHHYQQQQQEQQQQQQQQPNRLEFSLSDFIRSKLYDPFVSHDRSDSNSSPYQKCNYDTKTSSDGDDDDTSATHTSLDAGHRQGSHDADSSSTAYSSSSTSWPLRLRLGARKLKGLPVSNRPRATDKTLVLDLDETLIRARKDLAAEGPGGGRFDFMVVLPPKTKAASTLGMKAIGGLRPLSGGRAGVASSSSTAHSRQPNSTNSVERTADQNSTTTGVPLRSGSVSSNSYRAGGAWATAGRSGWGGGRRVYVTKRPHLKAFLQAVSAQFEVVIFTAARADFAQAVLDEIDPGREMVDHVLSRESCTRLVLSRKKRASVVKDLGIIGRPLSKVIMVENSLDAIRYHLENGVHISSFYGDRGDTELFSTLESLKDLALADDVRDGIIRLHVEIQARKEGQTVPSDLQPAPTC